MLFEAGDTEAALRALEPVPESERSPECRLLSGRIRLQQGAYTEALADFTAAARRAESPDVVAEARYSAGIAHWHRNELPAARRCFSEAMRLTTRDWIRSNARYWLETAAKRTAGPPYRLFARVGGFIDDNVRLEPIDIDRFSDDSDVYAEGFFSGGYRFFQNRPVYLDLAYEHYQTVHRNIESADLIASVGDISAGYRIGLANISLHYVPAHYHLDTAGYLRRHQIKPAVSLRLGDRFALRGTYRYIDHDYFTDSGKSGHSHDGRIDFQAKPTGAGHGIFGGAGMEVKSARFSWESFTRLRARVGIAVSFPPAITMTMAGEYQRRNHDQAAPFAGRRREDDRCRLHLTATQPIYRKHVNLVAEYEYTVNESTLPHYDYRRNVFGLSVSIAY